MKVARIGEIKHETKQGKGTKPSKKNRQAMKQLRKFKRNNS